MLHRDEVQAGGRPRRDYCPQVEVAAGHSSAVFPQRQVDGLLPRPRLVGHDGGQDVDGLRPGSQGDLVGVPGEDVQEGRRPQGVPPVEGVFEVVGTLPLGRVHVPDAPLVHRQFQWLLPAGKAVPAAEFARRRGGPCLGPEAFQEGLVLVDAAQQAGVGRVVRHGVEVDGQVVHHRVQFADDVFVPVAAAGVAHQRQVQRRVRQFHQLDELPGVEDVAFGGVVAAGVGVGALLVPDAPEFYVEGLGVAVFPAQVRPVGIARPVTVFNPLGGLLGRARGHVDDQHRFGADGPAILNEFRRPEVVLDVPAPDQIRPFPPLAFRPDAVLPVVDLRHRPPGEAQQWRLQVLHQFQHVGPEAPPVTQRAPLLVKSPVHAPPQVLDELPVQQGRHLVRGLPRPRQDILGAAAGAKQTEKEQGEEETHGENQISE